MMLYQIAGASGSKARGKEAAAKRRRGQLAPALSGGAVGARPVGARTGSTPGVVGGRARGRYWLVAGDLGLLMHLCIEPQPQPTLAAKR
eukprot:scaffold26152_cov126-Isochrysis_galbana.AAC.3